MSVKNKVHITEEELYDLYIAQGLSIDRIAEMYRCSRYCIWLKLKKYNITKQSFPHHYVDIDRDLLYKYRVEDKKTMREIANIFGVYIYTICKKCKQFNILDPNIPNACSKEFKEKRKKMRQEKLQKRREEHILEVPEELVDKRWRLYEQICRLHFLEYMPMEEVAKRLDIDLCEVNEIFTEYTI